MQKNEHLSLINLIVICLGLGSMLGMAFGFALFGIILKDNPLIWPDVRGTITLFLYIEMCFSVVGMFLGLLAGLLFRLVHLCFKLTVQWNSVVVGLCWVTFGSLLAFSVVAQSTALEQRGLFDDSMIWLGFTGLIFSLFLSWYQLKRGVLPLVYFSVLFLIIMCSLLFYPRFSHEPGPMHLSDSDHQKGILAQSGKLMIIGVDGATWDIVFPLIKMGKLSTFGRLVQRGSFGHLQSIQPMKSPLIWTTMVTGKLPEAHGITGFVVYQIPGTMSFVRKFPPLLNLFRIKGFFDIIPVTSRLREVKALWNILSESDLDSITLGWWATWPAETVKGIMVSDRVVYSRFNPGASGRSFTAHQTYPPEFINEITPLIVTPEDVTLDIMQQFMDISHEPAEYDGGTMDPLHEFKLAYSANETFYRIARNLLNSHPWQLMSVYFEGVDNVSHFFFKEMDKTPYDIHVSEKRIKMFGQVIPRFYQYQDRILGELLSTIQQETSVIILSDHGFTASVPGAYEHHIFQRYKIHSGTHHEQGIFIAAGPHIRRNTMMKGLHVLDIMPLSLYTLGLPIGEDMPGSVPRRIFTDESREKGKLVKIPTYEGGNLKHFESVISPADEVIKGKLKGLGYIE